MVQPPINTCSKNILKHISGSRIKPLEYILKHQKGMQVYWTFQPGTVVGSVAIDFDTFQFVPQISVPSHCPESDLSPDPLPVD